MLPMHSWFKPRSIVATLKVRTAANGSHWPVEGETPRSRCRCRARRHRRRSPLRYPSEDDVHSTLDHRPVTRRALITGITGQDGSYLAELLLSKGYEVHGLIRRSSSFSTGRIDHIYRDPHQPSVPMHLYYGDLADSSSLINSINRIRPDEVYNLGAQSHVKVSFEMPEFTADTTGMGTLRLLESIRHADWPVRYYQAGSSEMFGMVAESPQTETTPFYPRSPYAVSKVFAHWMTIQYREAY